MTIVFSLFLTK